MRKIRNVGATVIATSLLAACGQMGGTCSGVELNTEYNPNYRSAKITLKNLSDEPKLVTVTVFRPDGSPSTSNTIRLVAKDIVSSVISSVTEEHKIEIASCE